ncbi:MAG: patatin-like phospholipase family protein [Acidobacteria bacterium]|nr:MAG: patatin-like phospholipase family protein [Acidobacteriota bacterium]
MVEDPGGFGVSWGLSMSPIRRKWVFDTGGAGPGAWEGGVGYALTKAALATGAVPDMVIGSSVGAYMAANAASGDPETFLKGWSNWGAEGISPPAVRPEERGFFGARFFRAYLKHSIAYVLEDRIVERILDPRNPTRLVIVTTQLRRRNGQPIGRRDMRRLFLQSLTRKWPVKYICSDYDYRAILFDSQPRTVTAAVRKLTPENIRSVIMASCLIPWAMGMPLRVDGMDVIDGGFALKVPLRVPPDAVYAELARSLQTDQTVVITPDPTGTLWETSMRIRRWNDCWDVEHTMEAGNLLIISPPRKIRAGALCRDHRLIWETFCEGVAHAERVLRSDPGRRFFDPRR